MRALTISEVDAVGGGIIGGGYGPGGVPLFNAQDTTSGTFVGTSSPQSNTSGFGSACNAAAAIGGGAVGVAVTGGCLMATGGAGSAGCAFLGGCSWYRDGSGT